MAQKHNPEYIDAPMTRLNTMGAQQDNKRIVRGNAYTATKFSTDNPILQLGELGYETDTNKLKVGDGVTAWNDLPYAGDGTGSNLPSQTGNAGKFLTTDGTDASWASPVKSTTVTIVAADWNGGTTCTKTVSGLTATSVVWVAPDNASQSDYLDAGVYASSQTTDSLTFTCSTTPTNALTVNVIYC